MIRFKVNIKDVIHFMENMDRYYGKLNDLLKDKNYIIIYYEDLNRNIDVELETIFKYLQLPLVDVEKSILKKRVSSKLFEIIENFDELKEALDHTKFASFIDTD